MENNPVTVEKTIQAPAERIWRALTDRDEMKAWYFDISEFKPVQGFKFTFYGGTDERTYLHLCEIIEVILGKKLSYTWKYENEPGESLVTFELFEQGDSTLVRLTHTGLDTFTSGNPDLDRKNFEAGWNEILGTMLPGYVENKGTS